MRFGKSFWAFLGWMLYGVPVGYSLGLYMLAIPNVPSFYTLVVDYWPGVLAAIVVCWAMIIFVEWQVKY